MDDYRLERNADELADALSRIFDGPDILKELVNTIDDLEAEKNKWQEAIDEKEELIEKLEEQIYDLRQELTEANKELFDMTLLVDKLQKNVDIQE